MSEQTIPTYGYRKGEARLFQLRKGEPLPKGWQNLPVVDSEEPDERPEKPLR